MKSLPAMNSAPRALASIGFCALVLGCSSDQSPANGSEGTVPTGTTSSGETTTTGSISIGPDSEYLLDGRADEQTAVAIAGGTLAVTADGAYAVATDPDRDRIFLVELASHTVTEVAVPLGAELGRVIPGPPPLIYALGRRSGALYVVDPTSGSASVAREVPVCAAPRGLAFDSAAAKVHVACHSGKLLTLDALTLSPERELWLDVDLRDVLVTGSQLLVSRFRSAEVLLLSANGELISRLEPDPFHGCASATTLYRMALSTDQVLYLSHQVSGLDELGTNSGGYGNSCSSSSVMPITTALPLQDFPGWEGAPADPGVPAEATRSGITQAVYDLNLQTQAPPEAGSPTPVEPTRVGLGLAAGVPFRYLEHRNATGPFDVAVSPQGDLAQLLTGNAWNTTHANLWRGRLGPAEVGTSESSQNTWSTQHWEAGSRLRTYGEPVAVAFTPEGQLVIQSREPAALQFEDGTLVELSQESHANTGHAMFHMTAGVGISCASCHPEGSEDGHTWAFPQGLRRTQPLNGGVLQRAPFHWNGELASMEALVADVLLNRMGMQELVSVEQANALAGWLDSIPAVPVEPSSNPEAASRGKAVFEAADVGCSGCHSGPAYADNRAYDVGTGMPLFTPTLLGVGTRQPLMHDGCAQTLEARFGLCGGEGDRHGAVSHLDEAQTADLVEFLKTL